MRQRRRQTRGDEPGESVDDQRAAQYRHVARSRHQQRGDSEDQHQPAEVCPDEHQSAIPTVEQRPGERAEQRVRQEQHGERSCDRPGGGGPLGVEQNGPREAGLEQPVAELADRPQLEQSPEFG
jgi:hypothetical protein